MLFSTHVNHVSVSLTNRNGLTQGQRKTLTRVGIEPTKVFRLIICQKMLKSALYSSLLPVTAHC